MAKVIKRKSAVIVNIAKRTKGKVDATTKKRATKVKDYLFVPKGMTREEVLESIDFVVSILSPKLKFAGFEIDDIKQEGRCEAMEAMRRFDPNFKKSGTMVSKLRSFLFVHVRNRLMNLNRNKLGRTPAKQAVTCPLGIDTIDDRFEDSMRVNFLGETSLLFEEVNAIILDNLPKDMIADYHKLVADSGLTKIKRQALLETIREILQVPSDVEED